jgi:chromosome segregation ATPase
VEQALTDKDADREAAWENLAEMRERVARLTAELDEALAMLRRQHEGRVTSEAEVARLTAELDEARKQRSDIIATNAPAIRDLSNRAEAAEAEVARLRDALRGLLDTFPMDDAYGSMWFDYCAAQDAARAALGEEQ